MPNYKMQLASMSDGRVALATDPVGMEVVLEAVRAFSKGDITFNVTWNDALAEAMGWDRKPS